MRRDHSLGLPDYQPHLVFGSPVNGERSESEGREAPLTGDPETEHSRGGEAEALPGTGT